MISKEFANLPNHVAFIMDGNRRWAKKNWLPTSKGYNTGIEAMSNIITKSLEVGIKVLTFFAFSKENWNRSSEDVEILLSTLSHFLDDPKEVERMNQWIVQGVKIKFVGDLSKFNEETNLKFTKIEEKSKQNTKILIQIAISYSGRDEIVKATEKLVNKFLQNNNIQEEGNKFKLDEESFSCHLMTAGVPDPDLLIRTGNEKRVSNFLLWQISYCELFFSEKMWPDFTIQDFLLSLEDYSLRTRKYGVK